MSFEALGDYFSSAGFMPHIHCYMDRPALVWTMAVTDSLIGLSYVVISITLYALVRKIKPPFHAVFLAFGAFILACGATHVMEVYNLWVPSYWLAAVLKVITAAASVITAVYLLKLFPEVLELGTATKEVARVKAGLEDYFRQRFANPPELERLLNRAVYWPAIVALSLVVVAMVEASYISSMQRWVEHSNEVIRLGHEMKEASILAQTGLRGLYFFKNPDIAEQMKQNAERFETDFTVLRNLVSDNALQEQRLGEIRQEHDKWRGFAASVLQNPAKGTAGQQEFYGRYKGILSHTQESTDRFLNVERDLRNDHAEKVRAMSVVILITIGALTLVLGAVFTVIGRRALLWISRAYGRALESEKDALKKVQDALATRDDFFSIASHELKTPLTSLRLKAQMSNRGIGISAKSDEEKKFLREMGEQVERLVRLTDDMLDISRIRSGTLSVQPVDFDLTAMVGSALDRALPLFQASGIKLDFVASPEVMVRADRMRLEQAIANLLVNAVKYAPGKPLHVSVREVAGCARVEIRDEGPGIAPADQERIFQRFERAVSPSHVSGLGVGLYLARAILEAHGGTLSVVSDPGKGAAFTIELPRGLGAGPQELSLGPRPG